MTRSTPRNPSTPPTLADYARAAHAEHKGGQPVILRTAQDLRAWLQGGIRPGVPFSTRFL